jgi:hypothetical protein
MYVPLQFTIIASLLYLSFPDPSSQENISHQIDTIFQIQFFLYGAWHRQQNNDRNIEYTMITSSAEKILP